MIASPFALAAVERRAVADRDERILELGAALVVRMDVTGRDGRDAELLCQLDEPCVPLRVATLERPLQLDVERTAKR